MNPNNSIGSSPVADDNQPRTLYVGNLAADMTEGFLYYVFSQMGPVKDCKVIQDIGGDPYAFIEFLNHQSALTALGAMNNRECYGKQLKVNWATAPTNQSNWETSKHYHIFVGDLSPAFETEALKKAFSAFGEISLCRVVRDPHTLHSRGYGFVAFVKKSEAEAAIAAMDGKWLGNRCIRVNWASRKPQTTFKNEGKTANLTFMEVYNQTNGTNSTVYCGGFHSISEDLMRKAFSPFGYIEDIRFFKTKGFAFIKFATKESAAKAIVALHKTEIDGQTVKCSWGKVSDDAESSNVPNQVPTNENGNAKGPATAAPTCAYHHLQMGYTYPQNYYPTAPTAAQMQYQFLQSMQGNGVWQGTTSWNHGMTQGSSTQNHGAAYPMQQF